MLRYLRLMKEAGYFIKKTNKKKKNEQEFDSIDMLYMKRYILLVILKTIVTKVSIKK